MTTRNSRGEPYQVARVAGQKPSKQAALESYKQMRNQGKQPYAPQSDDDTDDADDRGDFEGMSERVGESKSPQQRGQDKATKRSSKAIANIMGDASLMEQLAQFLAEAKLPTGKDYRIILENGTVDEKPVVFVIAQHLTKLATEGKGAGKPIEARIATLYTSNQPAIKYRLDDLADYWSGLLDQFIDLPVFAQQEVQGHQKQDEGIKASLASLSFLTGHIHDIAIKSIVDEGKKADFERAWETYKATLDSFSIALRKKTK